MRRTVVTLAILLSLTATAALAHVAEHRASLSGDKVVPGPGDPDGKGRARIRSASDAETVCYKITFSGIGKATYAHIHMGAAGESGEKVVKLFASAKGKTSPVEGCRHSVAPATIERFHDNPSYVDVHTERHPDGALRGQLRVVE